MIEEKAFVVGLTRLAVACRQPTDKHTLDVYFEALKDQTNPPEWEEFTKDAVHEGAFAFFPKMSELLEALFAWRRGERPTVPALPPATETPDERAERRKRGLELFRAELKRLGVADPIPAERLVTETVPK
jgi:hypothetical protein